MIENISNHVSNESVDESRVQIWPRVYDEKTAGFIPAKIEAENGSSVCVESNDDSTQTLVLDGSFVLHVDSWGGATWGGSVGRGQSSWGGVHSDEYAVVAVNLALKTVLAADKPVDMSAGDAAYKEIFDVSEVMKTTEGIDLVTQLNSSPRVDKKPDPCASHMHEALDAFLGGVRSRATDDIYKNFWIALEKATNADGSDAAGEALEAKIMPITGSAPLACLRNVNNQLKHAYEKRKNGHAWKHCNCTNYRPPRLDSMHVYIEELRPLATTVIRKRLNEYV